MFFEIINTCKGIAMSPHKVKLTTRSKILTFIIGFLFFFIFTPDGNATHFEGGNLSWKQAGGNSIEFSFIGQYRYSYFYNALATAKIGDKFNLGLIDLGEAGSSPRSVNIIATVTNFDKANDHVYFSWTFAQTYLSPGNRLITAFYPTSAPNCCRDSDLLDFNKDRNFQLTTIVNVGAPYNNPPVTSLPSEINFPVGAVAAVLQIPGSDPDNDNISYRIAAPSESGLVTPAPSGLTLSPSGLITMNTIGRNIGQRFAMQVMIEDGKTKTPVDFTIAMVGPSSPPIFTGATPSEGQVFAVVPPGVPIDFSIEATDPDIGQVTSLLSVSLPLGATMTPDFPIVSPISGSAQSIFSWTPDVDQVGQYVINFLAQDNVGIQAYRSVTINVLCPLTTNLISKTNTTCLDPNGGSINIDVTGYSDLANLEFTWTGPNFSSATQNIAGLISGIYNLRVDDNATGCFNNLSFDIIDEIDGDEPVPPSAPADVSADCASDIPPAISLTATDKCDGPITVSPQDNVTPGGCPNNFVLERKWTFTDNAGNSSSISQVITVIDSVAPLAPAPPGDLNLECASDVPPPVDLTATDNCDGEITVSPFTSVTPGNCINEFTLVRTWFFADTCGNFSSVSQTITVLDTLAPVLSSAVPPDLSLECSSDIPPPVNLTAIDNCDGVMTVSPFQQISFGNCLNDITLIRTWTFVDTCGNSSSVSQTITVLDTLAPVLSSEAPVDLILECDTNVPDAIPLTAVDNCDGEITVSPIIQITPGNNPKTYTELRTWTFVDTCGNTSSYSQEIVVGDNTPPVIPTLADITAECELFSLETPIALDNCSVTVTGTTNTDIPINTLGLTVVTWEFDDGNGNTSSADQNVFIYDLSAPEIGEIVIPIDPIQLGQGINVSADFNDDCDKNDHVGTWYWGDAAGSSSPAVVNQNLNSVTGTHTYAEPGVYIITLYMKDASGNEDEVAATTYAVIYDPSGGFVTGGGWIESPIGAYTPDENLTGKANFGFVSKYKKGANVPDGSSTFHLNAARFKFKSTTYDWLVIAGANAKFKGEGQVNGAGNYGFIITGIDSDIYETGEADKFRIKIWDMDNGDLVIYDNQLGSGDDSYDAQDIGGGSITIHKPAKGRSLEVDDVLSEATMTVFPNPARDMMTIRIGGGNQSQQVMILDQFGKLVWKGYAQKDGQYSEITLNTSDYVAGMYFTTTYVNNLQLVQKFVIMK